VGVRVVVASCVLLIGAGVFVTDTRAWATAQTVARCGRPAAAVPSAGPDQPRALPPQRGTGHASGRSWRGHSLRAVGCSAWNEMHRRRARRA
jgi:hypothetical protein